MQRREHAAVIGAGMSGLLAAAALADHFEVVTVLERDPLSDGAGSRGGVPQARHPHLLLARGSQLLDDLLPGLAAELVDAGAPVVANLDDRHVEVFGHVVCQEHLDEPDPDLRTLQPSRALLEGTVRRRVRGLPNVEIRDGFRVRAPVFSPGAAAGRGVTGVAGVPVSGGDEEALAADLVVDASGSTSRAATWLRDGGFPSPPTHEVKLRMWYTTQWLRMRPDPRLKRMYSVGLRIDRPLGLLLFAHEDGTWAFSVVGMGTHACPPDRAAMIDAVGGFAPRDVLDALPAAMELSEPFTYDFPASRRSHFEDLDSHPQGFVVIGDAACTLNPFHGMGTTVAAMEALALRECLQGRDEELWRGYYRSLARIVDAAWQPWTGSDLAMPDVEGELTTPMRFGNAWVDQVLQVAAIDETVAVDILRVVGMVDRPSALLGPRTAGRVVRPRRPMDDEASPRQPLG